jgi:hypothetical protein
MVRPLLALMDGSPFACFDGWFALCLLLWMTNMRELNGFACPGAIHGQHGVDRTAGVPASIGLAVSAALDRSLHRFTLVFAR